MSQTGRPRTFWRFYLPVAGVTLVVLLLVFFGVAKYYLSSGAAAAKVSNRLEIILGMPVKIGSANIGIAGESSLGSVEGYEPGDTRPDKPWVTVKKIQADVAALDLLGDAQPKHVTLSGVELYLRFDKAGNLLTKLPHPAGTGPGGAIPQIHIDQAQLTLDQEGRRPMVVGGFSGDVIAEGKQLVLTGTVDDPYWAKWALTATAGLDDGAIVLNLKTPRTQVTQEKLERLPFIAPVVWEGVQAEGVTPVDFTLRFNTGAAGVKYRLETTPEETHVKVPAIKLDADHTSGRLVVEDALVELRGVQGKFVDGDILLPTADLDFRENPWHLKFDVSVKDLQLQKLSALWPLPVPKDLKGQVTGQAKLEVTLGDGKPHTTGSGDGVINTRLFGQPAPLGLHLHAGEQGFQFRLPEIKTDGAGLLPVPAGPGVEALLTRNAPERKEERGEVVEASAAEEPPGQGPIADLVGWIAGTVANGGGTVVRRVEQFFGTLGATVPKPKPTYLELTLSLKDVDLTKVIEQFGLKFSFPVTGNLSFSAVASLPVDAPGDLRAYRAHGTVTMTRLNVAGVEATQLKSRFDYRDGVLALEDVTGQVPASNEQPPGAFAGDAQLRVTPLGDLTVNLKLTDVPADSVLSAIPAASGVGGRVSGEARARVPVERLTDPAAWTATADLTANDARAYGLTLKQAAAHVEVANGLATVSGLRGSLQNAPITGSARVRLQGAFPYEAVLKLENADLGALQNLRPELRPPFRLAGRLNLETDVQGTLSPFTYKDAGKVRAENVVVEGVTVDKLNFRWETAADRVSLRDIDARLAQGRATGSAVVPLAATAPAAVDLVLENAEVEQLARRLLGPSVQLQGRASGSYHAGWTRADANGVRDNTTQLDLTTPLLRVEGFGVRQVTAHVDSRRGTTRYALTGTALDGKLELAGTLPRLGEVVADDAPATGHLTLDKGRLSKLGEALRLPELLDPLRGRVSLDINYRHGADGLPVGRGHFVLENVRWHSTEITDAFRGDLQLRGEEVRITNLTGGVGGGELGGRVVLNLKNPERGYFNLTLDRAEASQVVTPVQALLTGDPTEATGPTAPPLQGALQVNLRGNLGREWRGSGTVVLTRGKVYGVDVTEWRWPVDFTYHPRRGRAQIDVHDSTAQLGQGRATGDASFTIGVVSRVEGSLRFHDLDLRTVLRGVGDVGSLAAGRVSGRLKFSGNEVRSLDDVTATLDATLTQTQALELPVLRLVVPYVQPGMGSNTFQKGDLQARLANGVIRVQHLSLASDALKLVLEGTVTRTGRISLDSTATTGSLTGLNNATLLVLARQIPQVGPVPVALIAEASTFLANRVVQLHIGGTLRNPSVQVQPVALLTEEAVRLLLGRVNVSVP